MKTNHILIAIFILLIAIPCALLVMLHDKTIKPTQSYEIYVEEDGTEYIKCDADMQCLQVEYDGEVYVTEGCLIIYPYTYKNE